MNGSSSEFANKIQLIKLALKDKLPVWLPCSEYELISHLRGNKKLDFMHSEPGDTYTLFLNHFLLFHVLYLLRQQWWQQEKAHLDISPLYIQYLPYQASNAGLVESDPLQDYYLDLSNLKQTSQNDVDEMMGKFWIGMHRNEHRDKALSVLGLVDPVDNKTIKSTYQKLVMQYHPDRGGDDIKLKEVNMAMDILMRK